MAHVLSSSSTIVFACNFEELPLYWRTAPARADRPAIAWRGARIDGRFEVTYHLLEQDWHISDVFLAVDNGQCGEAAKADLINLDADDDERFYFLVLDALTNHYQTMIEEKVANELAASFDYRRVA